MNWLLLLFRGQLKDKKIISRTWLSCYLFYFIFFWSGWRNLSLILSIYSSLFLPYKVLFLSSKLVRFFFSWSSKFEPFFYMSLVLKHFFPQKSVRVYFESTIGKHTATILIRASWYKIVSIYGQRNFFAYGRDIESTPFLEALWQFSYRVGNAILYQQFMR